jgi:hypothetical protein
MAHGSLATALLAHLQHYRLIPAAFTAASSSNTRRACKRSGHLAGLFRTLHSLGSNSRMAEALQSEGCAEHTQ